MKKYSKYRIVRHVDTLVLIESALNYISTSSNAKIKVLNLQLSSEIMKSLFLQNKNRYHVGEAIKIAIRALGMIGRSITYK